MRNPTYEQVLTKAGIEWEYREAVPVDQINHTRGKQMQARLQPLDPELINEYEQMLRDGYEPPPLLLHKHGRSLLVPLDGNQRIAANQQAPAKHRLKSFPAYVVQIDDQMVVDRLCWTFNNAVNGRRLSYEECLQHAITFVRKYNMPNDKAAKEWGVKPWELAAKVRELNIRDLAATKGINTDKVPANTIAVLHPLDKVGEDVLLKALKTVAESGVGYDDVKELVSDVGKARTSEAKAGLVNDFCKSEKVARSKAATKGGKIITKRGREPRAMLQKHLDQLEDLLGTYQTPAFKPAGKSDRERYAGAALTVCNKLIEVYGLGGFLKGQGVA